MRSIPDTDQSNDETEALIKLVILHMIVATKSIKSIDVPNPKVNKENLLSGLSYLEQT